MIEIRKTGVFALWLDRLRDIHAKGARLGQDRALGGRETRGDVPPVGEGVSELRIDYGPGYPGVLYRSAGCEVVILLAGGDKRTPAGDISPLRLARKL